MIISCHADYVKQRNPRGNNIPTTLQIGNGSAVSTLSSVLCHLYSVICTLSSVICSVHRSSPSIHHPHLHGDVLAGGGEYLLKSGGHAVSVEHVCQ